MPDYSLRVVDVWVTVWFGGGFKHLTWCFSEFWVVRHSLGFWAGAGFGFWVWCLGRALCLVLVLSLGIWLLPESFVAYWC